MKWPVVWEQQVQQGSTLDCGIYIIKIMECIVTGSSIKFTQEYISKARLLGTYHILSTQFHQGKLPNIYTWNL
jgi:Ulp1 family protease